MAVGKEARHTEPEPERPEVSLVALVEPSSDADPPAGRAAEKRPAARPVRRRRSLSSLTLSILAVNVLALAILFGGLLFLDQYREGLIEAKIASLGGEAEIMAGALGQRAVSGDPETLALDPESLGPMIRRFVAATSSRARVFTADGMLLVDSRVLLASGREVQTRALPPPEQRRSLVDPLVRAYDWIVARFPGRADLPLYNEAPDQQVQDYREAAAALSGERGSARRQAADGTLIVSVAVPVQHFKRVLGVLMLSTDDAVIRESVRSVRLAIIRVFLLALAITILLSLFLARTIALPVRRLAEAADRVRHGYGRREAVPDFSHRRDEIGDLSTALSDMTEALYGRLDAIESFAADVAHEIKNPLTSLRSAVESLPRAKTAEQRTKLLEIINDDVGRLDRLISDISDASRLDAELSRAETVPVDLGRLLEITVDVYRATTTPGEPAIELEIADRESLVVGGIEDRLGQVVRNLLVNAVTFSPSGGRIRLGVGREGGEVVFTVADEGAGIAAENLETVFDRFYTLRPDEESFGTHSGLGLSISRQIVEAHGGTIVAENRTDPSGRVIGACFRVRIPA